MARRFRVTANFPVLGNSDCHQVVIVEGSNWQVALGKAARAFKRLPVMHRRRVTALNMMVEQLEGNGVAIITEAEVNAQPAAEQTVMEMPNIVTEFVDDSESLNQAVHDEAERLIADGEEIEE